MKKVYAIVQHYGHQETILCYVSSKKKLAKKIKELLHNEKENGFFDDKNILDYRYVEGASPYSYTACAIEVF